jgi:hypothetical protein
MVRSGQSRVLLKKTRGQGSANPHVMNIKNLKAHETDSSRQGVVKYTGQKKARVDCLLGNDIESIQVTSRESEFCIVSDAWGNSASKR